MADMFGKEVNFITIASIKKARSICRALTEPGGIECLSVVSTAKLVLKLESAKKKSLRFKKAPTER